MLVLCLGLQLVSLQITNEEGYNGGSGGGTAWTNGPDPHQGALQEWDDPPPQATPPLRVRTPSPAPPEAGHEWQAPPPEYGRWDNGPSPPLPPPPPPKGDPHVSVTVTGNRGPALCLHPLTQSHQLTLGMSIPTDFGILRGDPEMESIRLFLQLSVFTVCSWGVVIDMSSFVCLANPARASRAPWCEPQELALALCGVCRGG